MSTVKKKKYENYKQYEKALAGYLKSIYIEYSFVIKLTNASFNTVWKAKYQLLPVFTDN